MLLHTSIGAIMLLFLLVLASHKFSSDGPDDRLQRKMKATITCGPGRTGFRAQAGVCVAGKDISDIYKGPAGDDKNNGCSHQPGAGSLCSNDHKRRSLKRPAY